MDPLQYVLGIDKSRKLRLFYNKKSTKCILGLLKLKSKIADKPITSKWILGLSFLAKYNLILDYTSNELVFGVPKSQIMT